MMSMGRCLIDVGDVNGAVVALEKSLAIMRQWKPGSHDDVADGKLVASEHMHERTWSNQSFVAARVIVLHLFVPRSALCFAVLRLLSRCYQCLNDNVKASKLAEEALTIIKSTCDPQHPRVALCKY